MSPVPCDLDESLEVVNRWVTAVNDQDVDEVIRLSTQDIELVGPRGAAIGEGVLREWIARAGIRIRTVRRFGRNGHIVLLQQAQWRSDDESETEVATHFTISAGRVSRIARFDSLEAALEDAGSPLKTLL